MPKKNFKTKKVAKKVAKKRQKSPRVENGLVVIQSPAQPDLRVMVASELMDDAAIEAELQGQILPFYIYQFCNGKPRCKEDIENCPHPKITGLSSKGVNEVVRRLNRNPASGSKIRINPQSVIISHDIKQDEQLGVEVRVMAENLIDGSTAIGLKFEPYKTKRSYYDRDKGRQMEKIVDNTFFLEKALSKAERNAKKKLIPEVAAAKIIEKLLTENGGQYVKQIVPPQARQIEAQAVEVVPAASVPRKTTQMELRNMAFRAIENADSVDAVMQIDERAKQSENLTKQMKDDIRRYASSRVDALNFHHAASNQKPKGS